MSMMQLPYGATEENFTICENILRNITGKQDVTEAAMEILNIIYATGGDFSRKTIQTYIEAYLKQAPNFLSENKFGRKTQSCPRCKRYRLFR